MWDVLTYFKTQTFELGVLVRVYFKLGQNVLFQAFVLYQVNLFNQTPKLH